MQFVALIAFFLVLVAVTGPVLAQLLSAGDSTVLSDICTTCPPSNWVALISAKTINCTNFDQTSGNGPPRACLNANNWPGIACTSNGQNLQQLLFNNVNLNCISSKIGSLSFLQQLSLTNNQLTSIPSSFSTLTSLQSAYLQFNSITATPSFANMVGLQSLNLANNMLTSWPTGLNGAVKLQTLALSFNPGMTGSIPSTIGANTALSSLTCNNNSLSGVIPDQISSLVKLVQFQAEYNDLIGPLPDGFGNIGPQLNDLRIGGNAIISTIPSTFGLLTGFLAVSSPGLFLSTADATQLNRWCGCWPLALENIGGCLMRNVSFCDVPPAAAPLPSACDPSLPYPNCTSCSDITPCYEPDAQSALPPTAAASTTGVNTGKVPTAGPPTTSTAPILTAFPLAAAAVAALATVF